MAEKKKKFVSDKFRKCSAARLAAAQALYLMECDNAPLDKVIIDFLDEKIGGEALIDNVEEETEETEKLIGIDGDLFARVVRFASQNKDRGEELIRNSLSGEWTFDRLELTLKSIIRAGVAELCENKYTDSKVIISEYMDVAAAFYSGAELKVVNAVLDKIAKVVRL